MLLGGRLALVLMLASCTREEGATTGSSSAAHPPPAETESSPAASAPPSASPPAASSSAAISPGWQTVHAACADGVFVSQPSFDPQLPGVPTFQYFRFFENGVVVSAVVADSGDRATTNAKVMKWLNAESDTASKGTYRLEDGKIVADLRVPNAKGDAPSFSVVGNFAKPPFVMKETNHMVGGDSTHKLSCPLKAK